GPAVGPDGLQDVHIALSKLSPKIEIKDVSITGPSAASGWCYGTNPQGKHNAELVRDAKDPTKADLYFQPEGDLPGAKLTISIVAASGASDQAVVPASKCDPALAMPGPPALRLVANAITAKWMGQEGATGVMSGDVRIALDGLPKTNVVAAVALSNAARGAWF